jgi:large subunit ribosomal protein L15
MKAGRGGGMHGGKGNAGLHKHKYLHTVKYDPNHFGRHGFKRHPHSDDDNVINLMDIEKNLQLYVESGKAKKEKEVITLNLQEMGYGKLLGKGAITKPIKIIVQKASAKAMERVKEAGGTVEIKQ